MNGRKPAVSPQAGWTLVELMTVVAILGVLAAVVNQQYRLLQGRAQESTLRGNLGTLRAALRIYYAENDAFYPATLEALTVDARYIKKVPHTDIPRALDNGNPGHQQVSMTAQPYSAVPIAPASFLNEGDSPWGYVNDPASGDYGHVFVNCRHQDLKTSQWASW
jgi:prepilin-type N-terminal cleavage/methylation domain-containing protein